MIKKTKSGDRFQVYGRAGKKKKYLGTVDSRREALALEEEHRVTQRKVDAGELPAAIDTKRTFGTAVEKWLAKLEEDGSRSWSEYTARNDLYLMPCFENVPLVDVRKKDVIGWRDELAQKVSPSTVNTVLGTLSSAFAFFIDRDWCEHNPCHQVKRLKPDAKVFPWLESTDAITRLLSHCTPNICTLIAFLVGTGCRLDEALHLRWDDVDLEHRLVTVHRGRTRVMKGKERKGTTKSGKTRRVPIFDSVLSVQVDEAAARRQRALVAWRERRQAARPGIGAQAVQGCDRSRRAAEGAPAARPPAHVREPVPGRRRRHLQAEPDPRPPLGGDHGADLRAPEAGRVRGRLRPRSVHGAG
jgi:integrase